ncbi:serine carboxypeptidase-like protein [Striga asiatica]|uniref:Carboxypeptidase n=1 Tax=Striga asiatica TaxID=4170 RepID=A0A5A7QY01_STRAF|nr:serine carboxypeptidase-like protein [Striga asiatica]
MRGIAVIILFLTFSCLGPPVHSNEGRQLAEFIKARRFTKASADDVAEDDIMPDVYVQRQDGLKKADKIKMLPGQPPVDFDHYSGYVTVNAKAGRALFYYFAEAKNSTDKPLVLWLNGGPGCSSFGNGAMTELGPFRVNPNGKTLWYNKYAWNNVANIIFLESPAGVGFSYSNKSSDYITGDRKTAADSYIFLVNWLERFPEYKTRDFYITGESYAGHYVPQLADLILKKNQNSSQHTAINLKGIAIGNAYTDSIDQLKGEYEHFWASALISDEIHKGIVKNCDFSSPSSTCRQYISEADRLTADVYIYDIYAPLCHPSSNSDQKCGFDPCSDEYVEAYLNTPQVQKALHVIGTGTPTQWSGCSDLQWQDSPSTVLPLIRKLMTTGLRVWIYSGDTDGIVPVQTTKYSMPKLGAKITIPWYPWHYNGEVGGYVVGYENVTFVSIKGAGHFVPSYKPQQALAFFASFLQGKLPASPRQGKLMDA